MTAVMPPSTGSMVMACVGCPVALEGTITPPPGNVPDVYEVPFIVIVVALVGKELIRMLVIVPLLGSVAPKVAAGTGTLVVPPGLVWLAADNVEGVAVCSIPKFTLLMLALVTLNVLVMLLGVPSPAAAVPSPVVTQPAGSKTAGGAAPTVPAVVLSLTV